ncbi:uncharacterized protein LOC130187620 isoform X2 [Seriola aureovittata]|uniref:uncharacterized protein LOC130187620 isoform X2 n=1 Tax=Seriola aureovittata TaxID=2871759 RepID=UPI0024BDF4A1|nr:uncharacterized protein LOC130187620 isoform X2 [Seriola aureovittata]
MDKITHKDTSPQREGELTSPLSPKRPRTDCTVTNNQCGKRTIDFPELLTFRKMIGSPSSKNTLQKNVVRVCTAESEDIQNENLYEQPQDTKFIVTPITALTDDVHIGLSEACFITAERQLLHLGKDEQPPLTETDKLSSCPSDGAGGALAESHTSNDASADTSSHPGCKRLGKSLEDEPPGGCCFPVGDDEDGRQVQNNVNQIQAFTLSLSDEEVKWPSDCTYEDALHDAGFCNIWSQRSNQKKNKPVFSENILFSKEEEEGNSHISPGDYADSKSFYSNPEESGNLAEGVKNEEKVSELQICEDENVANCDGETKGNINENGMSKNSIPTVSECAEGSTVSYDVVLARNIAAVDVSVEVDDFCEAEGENAAGNMIAKAWSETADHTTETPMPARISQEPAEGDNDPGPFGVIDPAIWSETDREGEEKRCNSESSAGVELSPSVKVCETETLLPLCSDVRPSHVVSSPGQTRQFNQQSTTQQRKDEKEDLCQSCTEPQACSIPINETYNMTGNESSCHWKSSPSSSPHGPTKPPPTGDDRHESHSSVRHELKEQDQSSCFPVSPDHLKTHKVEYSQTETTKIKEREDVTSFVEQIKADELWNLEKAKESEEELLQQNEKNKENTNEISTGEYISDWTEGETSECNNRLTLIKDEAKTEEKEGKEVTNVGEEMKTDGHENIGVEKNILVKIDNDLQQQNEHKTDMTEVSHVGSVSEWTEDSEVSQVSQLEQGDKLSRFPDYQKRAKTFMDENKDELLVFTIPPTSDAVVPCQHDLSHSQNVNKNPTALNCNDRFSPVPSAFTFYDGVPGGFDTFEKIQLSPDGDDDDDAAGLGSKPLLTSLPGQLLKTSERQLSHSMPGAESDKYDEIPGEEEEEKEAKEEVERLECHIENMVNEILSTDSTCNEMPNFISEADIIAFAWPEQQPQCKSACDSDEHIEDEFNPQLVTSTVSTDSDSPSDVNGCPQFEMKKQFDVVLKELNLYFDISINEFSSDSTASTPEQCSDTAEVLVGDASNCEEHISSPELGHHRDTPSDGADEDCLEMCGGNPVVSCSTGRCDSEQEVPVGSQMCQETPESTAEKHREPQEMEQRRKMWSPSFMCPPFLGELSLRPPEPHRRLEPLRTCTRPIRVGLSKRAKTKHLHRPHPYK